ncbi:hypothetical protein B0A49_10174 [Cryomyces minteri]|uniref:glucan endo-1,3-beta-D-glucosidase n=1 Tax=Cryomyces minteri TaxID=331657 RepID=A0A4U0XAP4_9PEZI|nr:hypothetical protein B0A49_10174 [Cryomyces minteri]
MSSQPPQRNYSFNYHDEGALRPGRQRKEQEYPRPHENEEQGARGYQVSSIEYRSPYQPPSPREYTISPPSPPSHFNIPPPPVHWQTYAQEQEYGYAQVPRPLQVSQSSATARKPLPPRPDTSVYKAVVPPGPIDNNGHVWGRELGYANSMTVRRQSMTTPGMDNLGERAAGGGIAGIAVGIANTNDRDSGLQALRDIDNLYSRPFSEEPEGQYDADDAGYPYGDPLASRPDLGPIDPTEIADDDDDDGITHEIQGRKPVLGLGGRGHSRNDSGSIPLSAAAGAAGGTVGSGLFKGFGQREAGGQYGPVSEGKDGGNGDVDDSSKSEWLSEQNHGNKRLKWTVGSLIVVVIVLAIIGGVIGGVLSNRSQPSPPSVSSDNAIDLDASSAEIKKLLGNTKLHKVFPGMDYTPLNAQYPDCLSNPPSQNNITRDMAVLSQLTNAVRLYGTDCNQTEMVLHSINKLGLKDMRVWLGVWLGNNDTTNARQLDQMYKILDDHGGDPFAGVIVGNEVLFRKDLTAAELGTVISGVKTNLTAKNIKLPVATSDLGDNWTAGLANEVDIVMANIHPFFAGVTPDTAAGWTWDFWQSHDAIYKTSTASSYPTNVISEVGWPSGGGNDCGTGAACTSPTSGSVAGVKEMNTFMDNFVCQSLKNGTTYFWFEAFDEPWKTVFNTKTEQWEDKWGLMDANRNLKSGIKIPECGGQTVA